MNIVVVGHHLTPVSGHCKIVFEIAPLLIKRGHSIHVFSDQFSDFDRQQIAGLHDATGLALKIHESERRGRLDSLISDGVFNAAVDAAHVLHAFDAKAVLFLERLRRQRRLDVPVVYSVSTFPKVDRQSLCAGPWVFTRLFDPHNLHFLLSFIVPPAYLRRIYARVDHLIVSSPVLKAYITGLDIDDSHVSVLYPAIDKTVFPPAPHRDKGDIFRILYFGWFSDIRGVGHLLKAFAALQKRNANVELIYTTTNFHFIESKILARRIRRAAPDLNVVLKPYSPNISQMIEESDLVVLPFRGKFGYLHPPLTMLETIFRKRAFLTTPIGSITDIVQESELLVDDTETLADRMADVMADREKYQAAVDKCHDRLVAKLDKSFIANTLETIYRRL